MNYNGKIYFSFSKIIGKPVDKSVRICTPFFTDFGKNISIGKNVFINADCKFQDQGGFFILLQNNCTVN